jgi:hypothetical protein
VNLGSWGTRRARPMGTAFPAASVPAPPGDRRPTHSVPACAEQRQWVDWPDQMSVTSGRSAQFLPSGGGVRRRSEFPDTISRAS